MHPFRIWELRTGLLGGFEYLVTVLKVLCLQHGLVWHPRNLLLPKPERHRHQKEKQKQHLEEQRRWPRHVHNLHQLCAGNHAGLKLFQPLRGVVRGGVIRHQRGRRAALMMGRFAAGKS